MAARLQVAWSMLARRGPLSTLVLSRRIVSAGCNRCFSTRNPIAIASTRIASAAPIADQVPMLRYSPPTADQLLRLHARLQQPYAPVKKNQIHRSPHSRLLALDVGDRFVGVALSDETNSTAVPLLTLQRKEFVPAVVPPATDSSSSSSSTATISANSHHARSNRKHIDLRATSSPPVGSGGKMRLRSAAVLAAEVRALVTLYGCGGIVVGMPLNLEGHMDEQCTKTMQFIQQIKKEWTTTSANAATTASSPTKDKRMQQAIKDMTLAVEQFANKNKGSHRKRLDFASSTPPSLSSLPPFVIPEFLFWDERLSSADARRQLEVAGVRSHSRAMARATDPLAAAVILQELMERMQLTAQQQQRAAQVAPASTPAAPR